MSDSPDLAAALENLTDRFEALVERTTGHSARWANHLHDMQEGKAAHEEYRRGEGYGMMQESRMVQTLKKRQLIRQQEQE